jgi:hypothetical protein
MDVARPAARVADTGRGRGAPAWRGWWFRLTPLARDITVVLVVKLVLLGILWVAFFRAPAAPRMAMSPDEVAGRMIGQPQREVTRATP